MKEEPRKSDQLKYMVFEEKDLRVTHNNLNFKSLTDKEKRIARHALRKWRPITPILSKDIKTQILQIPKKISLKDLILQWIDQGLIPLRKENLYIDNRGERIGYQQMGKAPHIVFFLKKIDTQRNPTELKNLENIYLNWQRKKREKSVLIVGPYRLKMAWHERLFLDPKARIAYALLHIAKGNTFDHYDPTLIYNQKFISCGAFDTLNWQAVTNETLSEEIEQQYDTFREKFCKLAEKLPKDSIIKSNFFAFYQQLGKQFDTEKALKIIKELSDSFPELTQECQILINSIIQLRNHYIFTHNDYLIFKPDGTLLWNTDNHRKIRRAYNALGSILGTVFKIYNLSIDNSALDPHHGNIFFDETSNTITWIDLDWFGDLAALKKGWRTLAKSPSLVFALAPERWESFFKYIDPEYSSPLFSKSSDFFFPEKDRTPEIQAKLIEQRNTLFASIQTIYHEFLNGFITHYNPRNQKETMNYLRENPNSPIQTHRMHFAFKTIDEEFQGSRLVFDHINS